MERLGVARSHGRQMRNKTPSSGRSRKASRWRDFYMPRWGWWLILVVVVALGIWEFEGLAERVVTKGAHRSSLGSIHIVMGAQGQLIGSV